MTSWSTRLGQKQNVHHETRRLRVKQPHPIKATNPASKSKAIIPNHVRYEKEIGSHEDVIIYGNKEGIPYLRNQRQITRNNINKESNITNKNKLQIVLKDFDVSERISLFKFILPYLNTNDRIDFLNYCQKYCQILNTESELLYSWKFIYQQMLTMKQRRNRKKKNKICHNSDYKYFQNKCNTLLMHQHNTRRYIPIFKVKYDAEQCQLTFRSAKDAKKIPVISRCSMIIVSERNNGFCESRTTRCNWYNLEDILFDRKVINKEENRRPYQIYYTCNGYKQLHVDLMKENLFIGKGGNRTYNVRIVPYTKYECYLEGILPFDDKERRCMVSYCYKKGSPQTIHHVKFKAVILKDIVSVEEMQFKMIQRALSNKKLKVLVYGMEFDGPKRLWHGGRAKMSFSPKTGEYYTPTFVVVDYFE